MDQSQAITLAKQFYEANNQNNLEAFLDCFTDEIDWYGLIIQNGIRPTRVQGKSAMREFMGPSMERIKSNWTPKAFVPHENQLIVTGHGQYEAVETGFTFENDWVHILVFKEDKIDEVQTYIDPLTIFSLLQ